MGTGKSCQSCGMPFKKDENNRGANADGSKSELYCSYCYENRGFIYKETDVNKN